MATKTIESLICTHKESLLTASSVENATDALQEIDRLGQALSEEQLIEGTSCDCGPHGEHGL